MRNAAAFLVLLVLTVVAIPVLLVCVALGLRDGFLAYGYWMMRVGRLVLGIDLDVTGLERLDHGTPYVFMANHLSFLDAPLLVTIIDRPVRFVAKRFVFRVPVLGLGMHFAGYVPLDREGAGEGRRRIARAVDLIKARGYSFLIYPEGTRSPEGKLLPFRRGGFFLALDSGAPIVPVTIAGTYDLMPRGSRRIRKGKVRVVFHEPIPVADRTAETLPDLMERVRAAIASAV
jgi:1-acyl-sn-glycerol-3-phosphate acyltransferase